MLIKEAGVCCGLTKKAIEYYEAKGLIRPIVRENGYREYDEKEIAILKEIAVLRQCGLEIAQIKEVLNSSNKTAALEKYKYLTSIRTERLAAMQACMASLIESYDVEQEFRKWTACNTDNFTIKERLVFAFPGSYGLFFALHFGRFLNEPVDTLEKKAAYQAITRYIDNIELHLPSELAAFFETVTEALREKGSVEAWQAQASEHMKNAIADLEGYMEQNRAEIDKYLAYKNSDEFRQSPVGQMQKSLLDFQKSSGYQEIFITNMKLLSTSYAAYLQQLESASEKFIQKFPAAKDMYGL